LRKTLTFYSGCWVAPDDYLGYIPDPCTWWGAKILGVHPKFRYTRKFLNRKTISPARNSTIYALDFSSIQNGDIIEIESEAGGYNSIFYLVDEMVPYNFITVDEITCTQADQLLGINRRQRSTGKARTYYTPHPPKLQFPTDELEGYYEAFAKSDDVKDRIANLAYSIGWMDKALQRTIAQKMLPPDGSKLFSKASRMRARAAHPTTQDNERETCLIMTLKTMERIVMPKLLPKSGITEALDKHRRLVRTGMTLPNTPPPKPPAKTAKTASLRPAGMEHTEWFARVAADVIGVRAILDITAQINVRIQGMRKMGLTFVGRKSRMRINCPLLPTLGWPHQTDSKGYHYIILKPAKIEDLVKLAEAVRDNI
jgi:hypothetical protein